jgi:transcriptional regulator with XRE-family HTH domain
MAITRQRRENFKRNNARRFKKGEIMSIGKNILHCRVDKRIFQKDLAKTIGITANYLCQIERDKRKPPIDMLEKIATALGTTSSELLK